MFPSLMRPISGLIALLLVVACQPGTPGDTAGTTVAASSGATSGAPRVGATTSAPRAPTSSDSMTSAPISIRTDRTAYRATDPVTLTIVNGSASQYFYNPCTRVLEREN